MKDKKQIIGIIGSIILFVGVFMPIVSVPIMGSINYFQNGKGDGIFIIGLALASLVLTLTKRYKWLWLTGMGSLGVMIYTYINFQAKVSDLTSQMNTELADNPFKELATTAVQSVQIQWGVAVLIVGAALLIVASIIPEESEKSGK